MYIDMVTTRQLNSLVNKVLVDGVDVTRRCFEADTVKGYAKCFVRNSDGWVRESDGSLKTEQLKGKVEIVFPKEYKADAQRILKKLGQATK